MWSILRPIVIILASTPSGIDAFRRELSLYKSAKGSVQFPIEQPLPLTLIKAIVTFRVKENTEKAIAKKSLRICKNGHRSYKSNDCPVCPTCDATQKTKDDFLSQFSAPARRALESNNILSASDLSRFSEKEVMALHGMGERSLPKLKAALAIANLHFKTAL